MDRVAEPAVLCQLDELTPGQALAAELSLTLNERTPTLESVIVIRDGEAVRAWLNICPHAGRRLDWAPGKFLLKDRLLICAAHGAAFDISDGHCVSGPCRGEHLRMLAVEVIEGQVCLAV